MVAAGVGEGAAGVSAVTPAIRREAHCSWITRLEKAAARTRTTASRLIAEASGRFYPAALIRR